MRIDPEAIKHFVDRASQGASPGSSRSEKVANEIARALHKIGDDICLLDSTALTGLCQLVQLMAGPWATGDQKDTIYRFVAKEAARKR